jgi:hypothetical protein
MKRSMVLPFLSAGRAVLRGGLFCHFSRVRILAQRKHQNPRKIKNATIKTVDRGGKALFQPGYRPKDSENFAAPCETIGMSAAPEKQ